MNRYIRVKDVEEYVACVFVADVSHSYDDPPDVRLVSADFKDITDQISGLMELLLAAADRGGFVNGHIWHDEFRKIFTQHQEQEDSEIGI